MQFCSPLPQSSFRIPLRQPFLRQPLSMPSSVSFLGYIPLETHVPLLSQLGILQSHIMIIYCCLNILIHLINFVQKSKPLCELEKRGFLLNLELVQRYDFSMKQHQKI